MKRKLYRPGNTGQEETRLGTLIGRGGEEGLEVAILKQGRGRYQVRLTQKIWAEGIGWYRLRTIYLDERQSVKLQALLFRLPSTMRHQEKTVAFQPVKKE